MSDDVRGQGCEEYEDELAELALGVLTGRARAQVLSHVEQCARCAEELEVLSRTADSVVMAAPEMEPPLGFEVRLFERMGVTDSPRRRRLRPSRWVPAVVGVAAAALALGLGLSLTSSPAPAPTSGAPSPAAHRAETAALVSHGEMVGRVVVWGTAKPWMSMMLDDSTAHGHGALCRRHARRRDPRRRDLRRPWGLRGLDGAAPRTPRRRAHRRGGLAQRDGDRHRHAGLTTA